MHDRRSRTWFRNPSPQDCTRRRSAGHIQRSGSHLGCPTPVICVENNTLSDQYISLQKQQVYHLNNLAQITHKLQPPHFIFVTVRNDNLRSHLRYIYRLSYGHCARLIIHTPSLATRYLPKKPVHPNTVTTCPVTALYPGGP